MRAWIVIVVVLLVGTSATAVVVWLKDPPAQPETVSVTPTTLKQEVDFTGRIEAQHSAELGFESTGVAQEVLVNVGDVVTANQKLVTLDPRLGELEVAKSRADRLGSVASAQATLGNAQTAAQATKALNDRSLEKSRQTVRDAKQEMDHAQEVWQQVERESGSESSITKARYATFLATQSAYHTAQQALKETEKSVAQSNDSAQATVSVAQTAMLNATQASATTSGLSALAATEQLAGLRLSKTVLRAPFVGVVTAQNATTGEVLTAGQAVLTIQTVDITQVVAQVPETDVTKLAVGQSATVTLDAYEENQTWQMTINSIDPAAVLIEGVPTYKVILGFVKSDLRLKPGLTANVTVHVAHKDQVLAIPRRAVATRDTKKYVTILGVNNERVEREVTTGIVGTDGTVEITHGLTRDERVIIRDNQE